MASWTSTQVGAARTQVRAASHPGIREIALLAMLYVGYSLTRLRSDDDLAAARDRASELLHLESLLGLDVESWASTATAGVALLAIGASYWYATLHYVVTPLALLFVYRRHRDDYRRVRNGLVIGSAIGLAGFVLLPTAPPRLMSSGFTDVLATYADHGWWSDHASVPAGLGALSNELAAMPSLHVGWAIWVAWALRDKVGSWGRGLGVAYVVGTVVVVIATGNHWVLDAVAGLAVMAVGFTLANRFAGRARR